MKRILKTAIRRNIMTLTKTASIIIPLGLSLLVSFGAIYSDPRDAAKDGNDPGIKLNRESSNSYFEGELIAPTLPPKRWDAESRKWVFSERDLIQQERMANYRYKQEEMRKLQKRFEFERELQHGNNQLRIGNQYP